MARLHRRAAAIATGTSESAVRGTRLRLAHTTHYGRKFFDAANYWTLDADPQMRRYGAHQHVVAPLEKLHEHFAEKFFDLIILEAWREARKLLRIT